MSPGPPSTSKGVVNGWSFNFEQSTLKEKVPAWPSKYRKGSVEVGFAGLVTGFNNVKVEVYLSAVQKWNVSDNESAVRQSEGSINHSDARIEFGDTLHHNLLTALLVLSVSGWHWSKWELLEFQGCSPSSCMFPLLFEFVTLSLMMFVRQPCFRLSICFCSFISEIFTSIGVLAAAFKWNIKVELDKNGF